MNLAIFPSAIRIDKVTTVTLALLPILTISACRLEPDEQLIRSGGLGLSRAQWEQIHGNPSSRDSGYFTYTDERGQILVNFMDRAGYIKRTYPNGISQEEAREAAAKFMPADSVLVRAYTRGTVKVDLYHSGSLKSVFKGDDYWPGGEAGDFVAVYALPEQLVTWFVVGLGNNP